MIVCNDNIVVVIVVVLSSILRRPDSVGPHQCVPAPSIYRQIRVWDQTCRAAKFELHDPGVIWLATDWTLNDDLDCERNRKYYQF